MYCQKTFLLSDLMLMQQKTNWMLSDWKCNDYLPTWSISSFWKDDQTRERNVFIYSSNDLHLVIWYNNLLHHYNFVTTCCYNITILSLCFGTQVSWYIHIQALVKPVAAWGLRMCITLLNFIKVFETGLEAYIWC